MCLQNTFYCACYVPIQRLHGHSKAEEVAADFSVRRSVFDPMPMSVGFVIDRVVREHVFLRVIFTYVSIIPPIFCTESHNLSN
jgi:hypothetical protein